MKINMKIIRNRMTTKNTGKWHSPKSMGECKNHTGEANAFDFIRAL
jgi:hypothetical protein